MGALYGIGVDNAFIELDAQEVPIMDGSAKEFVDKINNTGLVFSNHPIKIIKINNKVVLMKMKIYFYRKIKCCCRN